MNQRVRQYSGLAVLLVCLAVSLLAVVLTSAAPRHDAVVPTEETSGKQRGTEGSRSPQDDSGLDGRLTPLPATYRVVEHVLPESSGRVAAGLGADEQIIYANTYGTSLFRPGAGNRVADDIITKVKGPCSLHEVRVRVSGGVEGGGGEFLAEVSLYDGCPDLAAGGDLIPGSLTLYTQLDDDSGVFHDLILDSRDRGICGDGTECLLSESVCADESVCSPDPLMISGEVWARIRFNTDNAGIVVGTPPSIGFSVDGHDDVFGNCHNYFGGWPTFAYASFWVEAVGPLACEPHHLAYLAANHTGNALWPAPFLGGSATMRLAEDVRLAVDDCMLSAYELGIEGISGPYEVSIDLRWPDLDTVIPGTEHTFAGLGQGDLEVARITIPPEISLAINAQDQPVYVTWAANRVNTGVRFGPYVDVGASNPAFYAFDLDPDNPETWTEHMLPIAGAGSFYVAVYCRGEPPRGACCPYQHDVPGADANCLDAMPITSCVEVRWLENTTCEENLFDPPCGATACCTPDNTCESLPRDECLDLCVLDLAPTYCEPACNGGANDGLPCAVDDDCPDGFCDPDELCAGQRTCGLTGCQLDGEFTGRPCDSEGPDQGATDCMTCTGTGEYCRPRCVGGAHRGRPCDPNGSDCPDSVCDLDADCPNGDTCLSEQSCVHEPNSCSLRCAKWESHSFCDDADPSCPSFACFDGVGDCFGDEVEVRCLGRCGGDPLAPCQSDIDCLPGWICENSDIDCPAGRVCLSDLNICSGRVGCDNLLCCKRVCEIRPECCDESPEFTWDRTCVELASELCAGFPPGNDECFHTWRNRGAFEIILTDDENGRLCTGESTSCHGAMLANNADATAAYPEDPPFCCKKDDPNGRALGTIWYKFRAVHESARIHTCNTMEDEQVLDSLIQVFRAANVSENGNDYDECNSLVPIACNDDSGCGIHGDQAGLCVTGLTPGETYFVILAVHRGQSLGRYEIDMESPCPGDRMPPGNNFCEQAQPLPIGPDGVPFSLANATMGCPGEPALPSMTNDIWFHVTTEYRGTLTIQTNTYDLGIPTPDTILALYEGAACPPEVLMGSNDDNTPDESLCTIGHRPCETDEDCIWGCNGPPPIGGLFCESDEDCPGENTCDPTRIALCRRSSTTATSSDTPCTANADCDLGWCDDPIDKPCSRSTYRQTRCADGTPCSTYNPCADGSSCEPECGWDGCQPYDNCPTPRRCNRLESCVEAVCGTVDLSSSLLTIPVKEGQEFLVRLGGEFGGEPEGVIRAMIERDDCNGNGQPDEYDIADGTSHDCDCDGVPDECAIDATSMVDCGQVEGPCESGPFFCATDCDADTNANGIPDCCDSDVSPRLCPDCPLPCHMSDLAAVIFSDGGALPDRPFDRPGNCAIDARQPHHMMDSAIRYGWDRLILQFPCDPTPFLVAQEDFAVETAPTGPVIGIKEVIINSVDQSVTVVLSETIAPRYWTCINDHLFDLTWCAGYLPANADQSGASSTSDINALIDSMNYVPGKLLPGYATDIDRSGSTNAQDVLRLIDLLNGAHEFQIWRLRSLPPCPTAD